MRFSMSLVLALALGGLTAGCLSYDSSKKQDDRCQSLADCNPGKTCGNMVPCVDGDCVVGQTVPLPCQQGCQSETDCPGGMHCRFSVPGAAGECVADGTCVEVSECEGLDHIDCEGQFECVDGACHFECQNQVACEEDADCAKVPADCCGCETGGLETAVPATGVESYMQEREQECSVVDVDCGGHDACTDRPAVCRDGQCMVQGDWCDCPQGIEDWAPVCGGTGARMTTLPSACVADCLDIPWSYPGRCDCMVDCYVADPVCATNHQTYWCGAGEAACNGQDVVYPAPCSDECDQCLMLGRPSIPVCTEDFRDFSDMCFAQCQGLDWWHTGACLEGEGEMCGGIAGLICTPDTLTCVYENDVPDSAGRCVKLGACIAATDCTYQGLAHDDCDGAWTCPDHTCTWECGI